MDGELIFKKFEKDMDDGLTHQCADARAATTTTTTVVSANANAAATTTTYNN